MPRAPLRSSTSVAPRGYQTAGPFATSVSTRSTALQPPVPAGHRFRRRRCVLSFFGAATVARARSRDWRGRPAFDGEADHHAGGGLTEDRGVAACCQRVGKPDERRQSDQHCGGRYRPVKRAVRKRVLRPQIKTTQRFAENRTEKMDLRDVKVGKCRSAQVHVVGGEKSISLGGDEKDRFAAGPHQRANLRINSVQGGKLIDRQLA